MAIDTARIEKIRQFNRFYTQIFGLLDNRFLKSEYSLAEARILFELGQIKGLVSKDLAAQLHLDPGYLSRLLRRFEKKGLIQKEISPRDTRRQILSLTPAGGSELARLQEMSNSQISLLLSHTSEGEQADLIKYMGKIQNILTGTKQKADAFMIRSHRPGDMGYITYRHALFYSREYGFDVTFDGYVAQGLSKFVIQYDPQKEHLWVVEQDTTIVGSIAIVKAEDGVAQLRWFLIEPEARGKGLGKKLLREAVEFSSKKGYRKIMLWTVSNLDAA